MKYAGLTDNPTERKEAHGNPPDWWQKKFEEEKLARAWEKQMVASGYQGGPGGKGWRYGYTYTISKDTKQ